MTRNELRNRLCLIDRLRLGGSIARDTLLAYAYLRGVPYRRVEPIVARDRLSPHAAKYHADHLSHNIVTEIPLDLRGDSKQLLLDLRAWLDVPEEQARIDRRAMKTRLAQTARVRAGSLAHENHMRRVST